MRKRMFLVLNISHPVKRRKSSFHHICTFQILYTSPAPEWPAKPSPLQLCLPGRVSQSPPRWLTSLFQGAVLCLTCKVSQTSISLAMLSLGWWMEPMGTLRELIMVKIDNLNEFQLIFVIQVAWKLGLLERRRWRNLPRWKRRSCLGKSRPESIPRCKMFHLITGNN